MEMKLKEVKRKLMKKRWDLYKCLFCEEHYDNDLKALRCCKDKKIKLHRGYYCLRDCGEIYESFKESIECCGGKIQGEDIIFPVE